MRAENTCQRLWVLSSVSVYRDDSHKERLTLSVLVLRMPTLRSELANASLVPSGLPQSISLAKVLQEQA